MSLLISVKRAARRVAPSLWTKLRLLRLRYSIRSFQEKRVIHRYAGRELTIHIADHLAQGWYDNDWAEPAEIGLLREHQLRPGAKVFDVGAHQGVVALILGNVVGPTGKVIAVEANSHNYRMATKNRDANGAQQVVIEHAAVADEPGELVFNEGLNGAVDDGSGSWGQVKVRATTIDALADQHGAPDVLFIDVEGYELHVLRGARRTLAHHPDCFIEVHVGVGLERFGGSLAQILEFFGNRYDLFISSDAEPRPVPFSAENVLTRSRFFLTAIAQS